ncbi:hypothetical protein GCM10009609_71100 [Pseudonocardia aurantiaca]
MRVVQVVPQCAPGESAMIHVCALSELPHAVYLVLTGTDAGADDLEAAS